MKKRIVLFDKLTKEADFACDLIDIGIDVSTYMFGRPFFKGPEHEFAAVIEVDESLADKVDEFLEKSYEKGLVAGWYSEN